ncbi:exonuclease 1 isoform X2 [Drosophila grimshawi]|nr:exonuclease 1 isoform X2 [Drosophila grimshawi]
MKAEATFKHMYIYNPLERRMERLSALENNETDESYCSNAGSLLADNEQALHLALGNLNPFTLKRLDNWHPDRVDATKPAKHIKHSKHKSIWQSNSHQELVEQPKETKQTSCALFFKKVDFVGQTIDDEIEANQRQEQAKHTEAELFNIYSYTGKRKRSPDENATPPASPVHSKSRHSNPFAKETPRSPIVCENASLLRLLSPKKSSEDRSTRVNALKRSIFTQEQRVVEVRSRFFGAPQVATEAKTEPNTTESESKQLQVTETASDIKGNNDDDAIILLSPSCSEDDTSSQSAPVPSRQETALHVKPALAPTARRVGLSKPKTNKRTTATKTAKLAENQTKLSMFGFQQRPVLK